MPILEQPCVISSGGPVTKQDIRFCLWVVVVAIVEAKDIGVPMQDEPEL